MKKDYKKMPFQSLDKHFKFLSLQNENETLAD